jgi:hypothetical protein
VPVSEQPVAYGRLAAWLVTGPFHAFWHYWMLSIIHLRSLPDGPEAVKTYPEATHEFSILSLDDAGGHDPKDTSGWLPLQPPDVCEQFHGLTDEQGVCMLRTFVQAICDGKISPDSDHRRFWHILIQQAMRHPEGPPSFVPLAGDIIP